MILFLKVLSETYVSLHINPTLQNYKHQILFSQRQKTPAEVIAILSVGHNQSGVATDVGAILALILTLFIVFVLFTTVSLLYKSEE